MHIIFFLLSFLTLTPIIAEDVQDSLIARKPLYPLSESKYIEESDDITMEGIIIGNDNGIFRVEENNELSPLWTGGKVKNIIHAKDVWYLLSSSGIIKSNNLVDFEVCNEGLPTLTMEYYSNDNITVSNEVPDLKDLCVNPNNPEELVTATKDNVYISYNGAATWESLGSMSSQTAGIKAVGIADMPRFNADGSMSSVSDLVVFMSHPIQGFAYIFPQKQKPAWNTISAGLKIMESLTTPDEVSDILPVGRVNANGIKYTEVYISQSFFPKIYKINWYTKRAECVYTGSEICDSIDALFQIEDSLLFTKTGGLGSFDFKRGGECGTPAHFNEWDEVFLNTSPSCSCALIPKGASGFGEEISLGELWLLHPENVISRYKDKIVGKKSIYVPAYQVRAQSGLSGINKFRQIIKDNNLNSLVIDMKDDYGLLRYDARDSLVLKKGQVSQYATDLDTFISEFKKDDVYLVARIVVFKDRSLSKYDNGSYAIWNSRTKAPWIGIKGYEDSGEDGSEKKAVYYDENWVDPYCPYVWEYDVAIARELVTRGFDEVQFDYIRFPTDGLNMSNASYRWQKPGMDKESALMSFLSYARAHIDAPIGIDIYGANGWYRSGTRTGQDVEMLSRYVDVIGPMFYPSHFENSFLNYAPYPDRPYRVYFYGTYRNTIIGRNRIVVRPWVQAFKLGVRYDIQYYGADYVQKEIFGVRDSVDRGYMYWNNVGNYETLQPDVGDKSYTGKAEEADSQYRKPAFSRQK